MKREKTNPKSRCNKYDKHLQYNKLIILRKKKSYPQTAGNSGFGFSFRILRLSARKGTHIIKRKFVYILSLSRTFLINQKYEVLYEGVLRLTRTADMYKKQNGCTYKCKIN